MFTSLQGHRAGKVSKLFLSAHKVLTEDGNLIISRFSSPQILRMFNFPPCRIAFFYLSMRQRNCRRNTKFLISIRSCDVHHLQRQLNPRMNIITYSAFIIAALIQFLLAPHASSSVFNSKLLII